MAQNEITVCGDPNCLIHVHKDTSGKQNVPVVDTGAWSADAAQKRLTTWATDSNGDIDYAKLKRAYLWSASNPSSLDDLKFPIMDVSSSGHLIVNRDALSAASRYLNRATGIPADELDQMKATLRRYYSAIGVDPDEHPPSIQKSVVKELEDAVVEYAGPETLAAIQKRAEDRQTVRTTKALDGISRAQGRMFEHVNKLEEDTARVEFDTSTAGEMTRMAKERVEKSGGKISFAAAFDQVTMANPDLYTQTLKERELQIQARRILEQQRKSVEADYYAEELKRTIEEKRSKKAEKKLAKENDKQ